MVILSEKICEIVEIEIIASETEIATSAVVSSNIQ